MACPLFGDKSLPKPMLTYCQLVMNFEQTSAHVRSKYENFLLIRFHGECRHFIPVAVCLNTLRSRIHVQHSADDISNCIFCNENGCISIKISLKFVSKGPIKNIPALVQIMAWRRTGDKPLSEPMMLKITDAYIRPSASIR